MPKYIVLAMVNHEAFKGRSDLSPFNFVHNDGEYLALCQDGRQVPAKAFQPQFNQGISVREFYNMFTATERHLKDLPLGIDREDFNHGYSLFVFNLNAGEDADALSPVSNGCLRWEMRFRVPRVTNLFWRLTPNDDWKVSCIIYWEMRFAVCGLRISYLR